MTIAYIGLGSNLDNPVQQLEQAVAALRELPQSRLLHISSFYQSKALGPGSQPDYVNAVVMLETSLTAVALLEHMQDIENKQGRVRGPERWQARTLDLDLLLYGNERIGTENLVVPHPEIANRNFVLIPLAEITPDLQVPGQGEVTDLLAEAGMADIVKLEKNMSL